MENVIVATLVTTKYLRLLITNYIHKIGVAIMTFPVSFSFSPLHTLHLLPLPSLSPFPSLHISLPPWKIRKYILLPTGEAGPRIAVEQIKYSRDSTDKRNGRRPENRPAEEPLGNFSARLLQRLTPAVGARRDKEEREREEDRRRKRRRQK